MLGGILIFLITGMIAFAIIARMKAKYPFVNEKMLQRLFFYHVLLALAYYAYVTFNPSDSKAYFEKVTNNFRGENWMDFYGTSTTFIEFIAFPFIKYMGFSYEAIMALFAFFGFLGYLYFYIFFKENIRMKHTWANMDLLTIIFFLPNPHFWSSSLGKGSTIFLGIGLFFYGISNIRSRIIPILIGGVIIYHVRPHVMLVILVSAIIGFMFSSSRVNMAMRITVLLGSVAAFFLIYQDVLALVNIDEDEFITQGLDLTHRANELSKATSGVDITNYNFFFKLFTFLYRPLFVDAPGALGLFVSVENVFYLIISAKLLLNLRGIRFLFAGGFVVKTAWLSFITVSIALAQISGNLGLAIRQKSQVMILLLFVITSFLDQEKRVSAEIARRRKLRAQKSSI